MTAKNNADALVAFVVDRSGSMANIWSDTLTGLNQFKNDQVAMGKKLKAQTWVTVAVFDNEYELLYDMTKAEFVPDLTDEVAPRGWTALYDAIGMTIASIKDQKDVPEKVVMVILTDGGENSSKEWNRAKVADAINERKRAGWQFVFIGADFGAYAEATSLGMTTSVAGSGTGWATQAAYTSMSGNVSAVRSGMAASVAYTDEQIAEIEKLNQEKS